MSMATLQQRRGTVYVPEVEVICLFVVLTTPWLWLLGRGACMHEEGTTITTPTLPHLEYLHA